MKSFVYKSVIIKVCQTNINPYLLSLEETAKALNVYPELIALTLETESSLFQEDFHYVRIDGELYFNRVGIIRLAVVLDSVEALEFAFVCEKELMAFEKLYENLKIASS